MTDKELSEHPVIKVAKREVAITKSRETRTGLPYVTLPVDHVVFLIRHYERVEGRCNYLKEQNQRYKQALEDIRDISTGSPHKFAVKALEGEE